MTSQLKWLLLRAILKIQRARALCPDWGRLFVQAALFAENRNISTNKWPFVKPNFPKY